MSTDSSEGLGTTRMEALSDGVFSVAMTLLLADFITENGLEFFLQHPFQQIRLFGVTFFVVAIYWMAHHNEMRYVNATNRLTLWLNLLFLASVALMPLSLAAFAHELKSCPRGAGRYYLLNASAMGVLLAALFIYVGLFKDSKGKPLIDTEGQDRLLETILRNLFLPVAYVVLLLDLEQGPLRCFSSSTSWVIQRLDLAILIPPLAYWVLTLGLSLTREGMKPRTCKWTIGIILALVIVITGVYALYVRDSLPFFAAIGVLTMFDVVLFFRSKPAWKDQRSLKFDRTGA
jgi:uncharacterized membrane protein